MDHEGLDDAELHDEGMDDDTKRKHLKCVDFAKSLARFSAGIDEAVKEQMAYWAPGIPRSTFILGRVGTALAQDFRSIDAASVKTIMAMVEQGNSSDDEFFSTAIATGLIEELVNEAQENDDLFAAMMAELGPTSRKYAIAWFEFYFGPYPRAPRPVGSDAQPSGIPQR